MLITVSFVIGKIGTGLTAQEKRTTKIINTVLRENIFNLNLRKFEYTVNTWKNMNVIKMNNDFYKVIFLMIFFLQIPFSITRFFHNKYAYQSLSCKIV